MAGKYPVPSPEIDLLLVWRKKMSEFNSIPESSDRIVEYLNPTRMVLQCYKRGEKLLETEELLPIYIYACLSEL